MVMCGFFCDAIQNGADGTSIEKLMVVNEFIHHGNKLLIVHLKHLRLPLDQFVGAHDTDIVGEMEFHRIDLSYLECLL